MDRDGGESEARGVYAELVERVGTAVRRMGAQSALASRAMADRFGMHTTDLEALDLIYMRGDMSAGDLAEASGLTSGSVTALIDRLAAAGYVERHADPGDRRRVMVRARPNAVAPIVAAYQPIQRVMFDLWSTYRADELELIAGFIDRSTEVHLDCIKQMGAEQPRSPKRRASRQRSAR